MNIAIYYTHCESLGHTTRVYNLIKELNKAEANILLLQAGKKQEYFNNKNINVINLPNPSYGKHFFYVGNVQQRDFTILKKRLNIGI